MCILTTISAAIITTPSVGWPATLTLLTLPARSSLQFSARLYSSRLSPRLTLIKKLLPRRRSSTIPRKSSMTLLKPYKTPKLPQTPPPKKLSKLLQVLKLSQNKRLKKRKLQTRLQLMLPLHRPPQSLLLPRQQKTLPLSPPTTREFSKKM